jgi:hypothetical protein
VKRYVIEREIPGAGDFSAADLCGISRKSCDVLRDMGPDIQWVESYVTGDRIYCVYLAESEDLIREHARRGGFPANRVSKVVAGIDPTTAGSMRSARVQ